MSVKISDLPLVARLKDEDVLPMVSGNQTSKVTYGHIKTQINNDLALSDMQNNIDKLQDDIEEVFQSVSDGKSLVASAITDKGVETANDATFQTMADNILQISGGSPGGYTDIIKDSACVGVSCEDFLEDEIVIEGM